MYSSLLKIGLIQTRVEKTIEENLEKTSSLIKKASDRGVKIICLQELYATKYFAQEQNEEHFKIAEQFPGNIYQFLSNMAKENQVILIGGSVFERTVDNKYYNTSLVFNAKGELIGKYRKMHIPQDPLYYEQFYFAPGDLGYIQIPTEYVTIAPLICYDQWFPEPARINALKGVQILFYPTAIGWFQDLRKWEPFSAQRWEDVMRAHASMNGIYVAAVNRVGIEDDLEFWGGSFVADPYGEIVARASSKDEELLIVDLDLSKIHDSQQGWGFLRNRRPESYTELVKKYEQ